MGFCIGAKYVVRLLQADTGVINSGYIVHPFVNTELRAIKGPLFITAAETDSFFPREKRYESAAILKETGLPYQISLHSGVAHE